MSDTKRKQAEIVLVDGRSCTVYLPDGWTVREVRGLEVVHDERGVPVTRWTLGEGDVLADGRPVQRASLVRDRDTA